MNIKRRRFIFLSTAVGVATVLGPHALPRVMRRLGYTNLYQGPLTTVLNELLLRLERNRISPTQFLGELQKYYDEHDLLKEFDDWIGDVSVSDGFLELYHNQHQRGQPKIQLFFLAPNSSHPPHAHHNLLSSQCILKGKLHVRQYERVARINPQLISLRPVSDKPFLPSDTIVTTEFENNVHWFGADETPTLVLNINARSILKKTFETEGQRAAGRYFIDPTTNDRDGDLIIAQEISQESALNKFANRPLRDFSNSPSEA